MVVSPAQFPTRVGATGYRTAGGNRKISTRVGATTGLQVEIEGNTTRDLLAFPTQETHN